MRIPQFRLRTAVALVALAALAFAYVSRGIAEGERQAKAVAELRSRRVAVIYDWTVREANDDDSTPVKDPSGRNILRRMLGDDFFDKVVGLHNHNDDLSDADLAGLAHLHDVKYLNLARCRITDAGLDVVAQMQAVTHLDVSDTAITDAGVAKLVAMRSLRSLIVLNTQITRGSLHAMAAMPSLEGVAASGTGISVTDCDELRRIRPGLRIEF